MSNKVRWGILSTSRHAANSVIPAIHESDNGEVVAVASRDAERAKMYAKEYKIPNSYGDYESLLADANIDVIYNPLPNSLHKEWSIKAAQAGKHVLCEKPIALDAAEAVEMVQAFKDAGLKLAETFQWRHLPQALHTRQMVNDGAIGDVVTIDAGFTFMLTRAEDVRWNPELGGGALYDVGCYPISLTRFITGQEPVSVTAQATFSESGVDDVIVATLQFPGGVLAHINASFKLPVWRYYEIRGTDGTLRVNNAYNTSLGDPPNRVFHYGADYALRETYDLGLQNSYTLMVNDFNDSILNDTPTIFPPEDAIANMRVIDAILKAAREGVAVNL
jgi:D-xylose 1-dehydrogenase (NADP+, D-xylono-1,5-lactone-forming)